MKNELPQNCSPCAQGAHYVLVDYENRKYFRCERCGYYQISVRAEKRLSEAPQEWRDSYSLKAQSAPEGYILFIRIPSAIPDNSGVALEAEYLLRSEAPS